MNLPGNLRELPPLILHPFDHRSNPDARYQVVCNDSLTRRYLQARYDEFRMLCLIGTDLNRWLEQCVEMSARDPELAGLSECSFIALLLFDPPVPVVEKMSSFGIKNFQIIFSRAIGLNAVFPHPPPASDVSELFLRGFSRYADALYDVRLKAEDTAVNLENKFTFEFYASGEYSSYLEKHWE